MGRLNNSVEIIPIDGPSGLPSRQNSRNLQTHNFPNITMSYLGDPYIVTRVKQVRKYSILYSVFNISYLLLYLGGFLTSKFVHKTDVWIYKYFANFTINNSIMIHLIKMQ